MTKEVIIAMNMILGINIVNHSLYYADVSRVQIDEWICLEVSGDFGYETFLE